MELLPQTVANTLRDIYGDNPFYEALEWWYHRFAWHFIKAGIPEYGVSDLLKNHIVPVAMVKQYGRTTGLIPERVAKNILNHRHDLKEYDPLAKPKIRVTTKKITDYRKRLEDELRRIWTDTNSLEEIIREECYESTDEEIAKKIKHGTKAEVWASNLKDL